MVVETFDIDVNDGEILHKKTLWGSRSSGRKTYLEEVKHGMIVW